MVQIDEPKLLKFAERMQIELNHNQLKKGSIFMWKGIEHKVGELDYHKAKLMMALKQGDRAAVKEYIADCANILMAIGDEYGLYDGNVIDDGMVCELKDDLFRFTEVSKSNIVNTKYKEQ